MEVCRNGLDSHLPNNYDSKLFNWRLHQNITLAYKNINHDRHFGPAYGFCFTSVSR